MQTYTTQMDAARKGIITPEMEIVAKKEDIVLENELLHYRVVYTIIADITTK